MAAVNILETQTTSRDVDVGASGAGTNLKVGAPIRGESGGRALHFLALKAQLIVLVSAFVMASTIWSVSCLLFFYSRCPAICKSGVHVPPVPHGVGTTAPCIHGLTHLCTSRH